MVGVAQSARALDCGSKGCGIVPRRPPHFPSINRYGNGTCEPRRGEQVHIYPCAFPMSWFLYMLQCADGSLYTGVTTDIPRRISEHNYKKGAFYTRNKTPVKLVHQEAMPNQSEALKREAQIKRLTRKEKLMLIKRQ